MDSAAIFTEITKPNALRRKAQLPLFDVCAEMAHAGLACSLSEYAEFCDRHKDKLEQFRAEVLTEMRATKPGFGYTLGGRLAVAIKSRRRFEVWIEDTFGVVRPSFVPKNPIIYGADCQH